MADPEEANSLRLAVPRVRVTEYLLHVFAIAIVVWGWWVLEQFTDIRFDRRDVNAEPDPITILLPLIGTGVAILIALIWWIRDYTVVKNGVVVEARIESFGLAFQGRETVVLVYKVGDRGYRKKISLVRCDSKKLRVGDTIRIVAHRREPKNVYVLN